MRHFYLLFFLLILGSCKLNRKSSEQVESQPFKTSVASKDTLRLTVPDTLSRTEIRSLIQATRIKNKGTIIIQTGAGAVASSVNKPKAPVATAAHEAQANEVVKPKAPVSTGKDSPISIQKLEKEHTPTFLFLLLLAAAALWAYNSYKKS